MIRAFWLMLAGFVSILLSAFPVVVGIYDSLMGRGNVIECIKTEWERWFSGLDDY